MAQFYAEIQGNRGEATQLGGKESGIRGHIRGWGMGISVDLGYSDKDKQDYLNASLTSGSNHRYSSIDLLSLTQSEAYAILSGEKKIKVEIVENEKVAA